MEWYTWVLVIMGVGGRGGRVPSVAVVRDTKMDWTIFGKCVSLNGEMAIKKVGECSSSDMTGVRLTGSVAAQHYAMGTFKTRSKNCEKQLLASSCLSVRPHGTTGRIIMKFVILYFSKIENSSPIKYDGVLLY